ncbi:MAG: hypothetical protein ACQGVC_24180 [Myxococcota bacterium]
MRSLATALLLGLALLLAPAAHAADPDLAAAEARLAADPDDFEALLGAAEAGNFEMAKRTNGNLPLVDGLQDSDANRAIWAELAPPALDRARRAHALRPDSVDAAAALANAYMFYSSSLGILSAILRGAAGEYTEHATRLIEMDPSHDEGLGDYLMASYYLVAPWPIGDSDESLRHYERAAALAPRSVRNHYGLAVYWAREGDAEKARRHFDQALALPCTEKTERAFCGFMKAESERARSEL